VYVAGGGDYQVHAIDLNSGMKKWSTRLAYPAIYESPIYHDGVLYITSHAQPNAKVIALNANTGGEIWSKEVGNTTYFGGALGQDSLFVGTYQSRTLTSL
ncbi:PQQ-binding-like beta-propeller repeat protein, partial [Microvirga sp. 3-52]|nr:PQQ-binding-like beta-propeller repeat protein [Microvirga sp. 3-52]